MAEDKGAVASQAASAMGGAMMGEIAPFGDDPSLPDHSQDIAEIFNLGGEAGPVPNPSEGSGEGGASASSTASAAEGGEGQAQQPATPPTPQPQPGQQGEPQPQAPAQPQPAPAAPPAAPVDGQPQAPSGDPTVQALSAQVQALVAQNAELLRQLQSPQGAGQPTPQPPSGTEPQSDPLLTQHPLMDYRLGMPDDLAAAVLNDDPAIARQGLTHLINATAREIHTRAIRHVDELVNQRLANFGTQSQLSQQQEQMRQQYFTAYPQHGDPGIRLIVAQEAQAMWAQNPNLQFDQNAINALGARVNTRLGWTGQQPAGAQPQSGQQPAAQGQPAPRPAAQMGASNRPAADPQDNDSSMIVDVLTA
jgi:hypothetical protein